MPNLHRTLAAAIALSGTAAAAPYLGTTTPFTSTSFCRAHTCKLVATVPSGSQDQLHYDVDGRWRVIVWRSPNDLKRVGGQPYAKLLNRVNGVSMVWYGLQDLPMDSLGIFTELVKFATSKALGKDTATMWMEDISPEAGLRPWNSFTVIRNGGVMPGANAGILELMVAVTPR